MTYKLVPNKNHKKFLKELTNLIKDYGNVEDFRNKEEIASILKERLPALFNNFDKQHEMFEPVSTILVEMLQNLGTVLKFIKEEAK